MSRILVVFASSHGHTHLIADTIAAHLRRRGHTAELGDAFAAGLPPPEDYDGIVIGSRVQLGRHAREVVEYVVRNRRELGRKSTAFFSVSMAAAKQNQHGPDPQGYVEKLFRAIDWRPNRWRAFAGGLPYRKYSPVIRFVMKLIARRAGDTTDTSRDHDFTDWDAVKKFADQIATDVIARGMDSEDPPTTIPSAALPQA